MKIKIGIIVLVVVSIGLLIALIVSKKLANDQQTKDAASIQEFSNQLDTANINLNDLRQVNLMLTNDLESTRQALDATSNNLAETSGQLAGAKTEIESDQNLITNLNGRISDLEAQNKVLDDNAAALSNNIASLNGEIATTRQQLATSQTNNAFLTAELQKQMAQRAELERKFNDIDEVRAQVKKLHDELFEARRLRWMNAGTDPSQQRKGAELLMRPAPASSAGIQPSLIPSPRYDLNVEVGSDGSVHIIPTPPVPAPPGATPPAANPAPAVPGSPDNAAQAAARAALLKEMGDTNAVH